MDNKKQDWKSGQAMNSDKKSCGCGSDTGYSPAENMNSSMKDQSSKQYGDQKMEKKDHQMSNNNQMQDDYNQNMEGKSCDSGIDGIIITETVSTFYPLNDDMSDDQDLSNKLNEDSEDLTDNR